MSKEQLNADKMCLIDRRTFKGFFDPVKFPSMFVQIIAFSNMKLPFICAGNFLLFSCVSKQDDPDLQAISITIAFDCCEYRGQIKKKTYLIL